MPDIKAALTKQYGPLPAWGWGIVGIGGFVVWRAMSGGTSGETALVPYPSGAFGTSGGGGGGATTTPAVTAPPPAVGPANPPPASAPVTARPTPILDWLREQFGPLLPSTPGGIPATDDPIEAIRQRLGSTLGGQAMTPGAWADAYASAGVLQDAVNRGLFGTPVSYALVAGTPSGGGSSLDQAFRNFTGSGVDQDERGMVYRAYRDGSLIAERPVGPTTDIVALNRTYGVGAGSSSDTITTQPTTIMQTMPASINTPGKSSGPVSPTPPTPFEFPTFSVMPLRGHRIESPTLTSPELGGLLRRFGGSEDHIARIQPVPAVSSAQSPQRIRSMINRLTTLQRTN